MRLAPWAVIVLTVCLVSCTGEHSSHDSNDSKKEDHSAKAETSHDSHDSDPGGEAHEAILDIPLNDGSKWAMDDHTRSMFQAMTARVEAGGDPGEVGKGLQADLQKLIQGCTMTGEAHDQLHAFLMAYMPAVREVAENGSMESFDSVKGLLQEYPNYFE